MIDRRSATVLYAVLSVVVTLAAVVGVADYRASLADGGVEGPAADCPAVGDAAAGGPAGGSDGGSGDAAGGSDAGGAGDGSADAAASAGEDCGADGDRAPPETVATTGAS